MNVLEWICHSSLAIWLFTVLVDRRQYEAVMIRNRKYKIQTDVSNFNPSGTWPKPEVTNSVTFLLILQFWAFQHWWNVNLPKSLKVCWFTTIGRSMLHWKLSEGSLAAGFLPILCNVLLECGGLASMSSTSQKYQIVSCGNWRSKSNIPTSLTDSLIEIRVNKDLVKCVWGGCSEIKVFVHFVFYISLSTFTFIFSPKSLQSKFYPLVKVKFTWEEKVLPFSKSKSKVFPFCKSKVK